MKNVEFFDWHLNFSQPLSYMVRHYGSYRGQSHTDIHDALHLGFVLKGSREGFFGTSKIKTSVSGFYLTAPWEPHCTVSADAGHELLLLNIDWQELQNAFFTGRDQLEKLILMKPEERMLWINKKLHFDHVVSELQKLIKLEDSVQKELLLWNHIQKIFIQILPDADENSSNSAHYKRLLPALKALSGKVLSVHEAAKLCHLSTSYFSMLFKKQFGLSFAHYERNFRLKGAFEATRRGATLKEAAFDWGFCDKCHLARLLKGHRE